MLMAKWVKTKRKNFNVNNSTQNIFLYKIVKEKVFKDLNEIINRKKCPKSNSILCGNYKSNQ